MMHPHVWLVSVLVIIHGSLPADAQPPASPVARRASADSAETAKPLPPALVRARTVFLINETPGSETEFRRLRAQLDESRHFMVVDSASRADVTISLRTRQVEMAGAVSGAPYGANFVNPSRNVVRRNVSTLTVRQRTTGEILWSRESDGSATALEHFQREMPRAPRACVVFWCW